MQQLFEPDFCEKSANIELPLSVEDKLFLSEVDGSVTKLNGHYQITLPWRQKCVTLPNNRVVAERRRVYLKLKFERDADIFDQYKEKKKNELLRNGFARKVPPDWKPDQSFARARLDVRTARSAAAIPTGKDCLLSWHQRNVPSSTSRSQGLGRFNVFVVAKRWLHATSRRLSNDGSSVPSQIISCMRKLCFAQGRGR